MKEEIENYLTAIGVTTTSIKQKIDYFIKICHLICQEEIIDIFIDDYLTEDGTKKYSGITLFTKNFILGAENFLDKDEIYCARSDNKICYLSIDMKDYDFCKATEKSRINIQIYRETGGEGFYKASKENCDYLRDIYFKYILPRVIKK